MSASMRMVSPVTSQRVTPTSLYVHIPFCASRCFYCDFTTYVAPPGLMETYVEDLVREFRLLSEEAHEPLKTVFFGGGTPTLLSPAQLDCVMTALSSAFHIEPGAEITMEANPGTVNEEKLAVLRSHGVNRLSFGAQTFDGRLLMAIGRSHDVEDVRESIEMAARLGFDRLNLDLMFGLPEQSLDDVAHSLREVLALGVEHISAYWLKVEAGTPFGKWAEAGMLQLPGEDEEGDMYDLVRSTLLQNGFLHYEISNFARPGAEARHNLVYWRNEPYFAAGVGAHGYVRGIRYENVKALQAYHEAIQRGDRPLMTESVITEEEYAEDTMMLGLRLREGVSRDRFLRKHGIDIITKFDPAIARLQQKGLVEWVDEHLRITDRAWPIANLVFEEFISLS